jgi:aminoglycoside phosphotransferase (APT) family kinase protein
MTSHLGATTAVRDAHRFDEAGLARYLADHLPGFRGPMAVRQFEGGQSNPTFLLQAASGDYVLRKKPPGRLLPSAHQVDREYRVMTALQGTGVPVPPALVSCEEEGVIGTGFFVMGSVPGRVFRNPRLPGVAPADRRAMYDDMVAVLARLHGVDVAALGLSGFGKSGNYFARQISRWGQQYLASKTDEMPAMDRLMDWLPAHIPADDTTTIVHGDYRVENLIFHPTEPRIAAVVDWELSTLGHPLADFSYHCMSWHIPPGHFRGIAGLDLAGLGIPEERQYIDAYCRRTGRGSIGNWDFYLAYNMFRLAAILQGIKKRALDGIASSRQALDAGDRARPLAELGWEYAQKAMKNA